MPTEHEFKFVLKNEAKTMQVIQRLHRKQQLIEQGYLVFSRGNSARVRHIQTKEENKWVFTFKHKVGGRVVELEHAIDSRDGEDLWKDCMGKLKKIRYILEDKRARKWEVDFFLDQGENCYFAMAEIELPEGKAKPKHLPPFIKNYLIHDVSLTDERFSNKRLGDVNYATKLYTSLIQGEKL